MVKLKKAISSLWFFYLVSFLIYSVITLLVFSHRLPHITSEYGMPDVDTDGGLWYQWFLFYSKKHGLLPQITTLFVFPFGFDLTFVPFSNLIYSAQFFFLEYILGFSWSNLVLVTNISSLITYPFSAISASLLSYYTTRNRWSAFIAGCIYSFSFYHVYMGRGQMSINHIEFIPLYILSLLYFIDRSNVSSLLISASLFSLTFMADPYYAFFAGIYSTILMIFYGNRSGISKLRIGAIYYGTLFIILVLSNLNFIISNLYLFDQTQLVQSGRNSIPRDELVNILYYFSRTISNDLNYLDQYFGYYARFIEIVPLGAVLAGLVFFKSNRNTFAILICLLISIVLSSYIPLLYPINVYYFKYFGMFRGVSRMILPSALFLGLLVGILIKNLIRGVSLFSKLRKCVYIVGYLITILIVVYIGINNDITWRRNTNFSKIAAMYEPIRKNEQIKVIATYPMTSNGKATGCPEVYQLVAQIVHNKMYACGASPFSKEAQDYYTSISDITKKDTIDTLTKYNIDTIIVSNDILKNSQEVNAQLKSDPRVDFIGHYHQSHDRGNISLNDLSRNISVYQIKAVVRKNLMPAPLIDIYNSDNSSNWVDFKKIDPYRYIIHLRTTSAAKLTFNAPYSEKWVLLDGDHSDKNDAYFLNAATQYKHTRFNDYANAWTIPPAKNTENTISLTLYFAPRSVEYVADKTSIIVFILSLLVVLSSRLKMLYIKGKVNPKPNL